MRTIETKVYKFDELGERAKERARDWYRQGIEGDDLADTDDWQAIAAILGIEFATRAVPLMGGGTRHDPRIYWSGFSSQGDGACFEGTYSFAKGAPKAIRAHAPQDTELHGIADTLAAVQRRHFYQLEASISHRGRYYHSGSMSIEVTDARDSYRDIGDSADIVEQAMRDFADWIYRSLEREWEYRNSDECVDETILINEYEFDEDGNRA